MQPLTSNSQHRPENKKSVLLGDEDIHVLVVSFGSKEYYQSVAVRYEVLRKPLQLSFDPQQLAQEGTDLHVVAFDGDKAIGTLILSPHGDIVKMRQVAVLDAYQNRGVGAQMVEVAETVSRDLEMKSMVLHARKTAVPFYLKLNYQKEGDEFLEVGIPHFRMFKDL